jgi:hypothetical protein
MSITRKVFDFEKDYTRVPNRWIRNAAVSRRARLVLIEILSHDPEWEISESTLIDAGIEGRDAIRDACNELEAHGYLVRQQKRDAGQFAEAHYELADPTHPTVADPAKRRKRTRKPVDKSTVDGFTVDGKTDVGKSVLKEQPILRSDFNQSSTNPHQGAVDNSQTTDDRNSAPKNYPTPRTAFAHAALDPTALAVELTDVFEGFEISTDQLHSIGVSILARAKGIVSSPMSYVIESIRREPWLYQSEAMDLAAGRAESGGNLF